MVFQQWQYGYLFAILTISSVLTIISAEKTMIPIFYDLYCWYFKNPKYPFKDLIVELTSSFGERVKLPLSILRGSISVQEWLNRKQ